MPDIWLRKTISFGDLELVLLPGIGGRLWDVVFQGQSLLFQNDDLQDDIPDLNKLTDLPTRSPQFGFPLWGGEKTWIAPDKNWPNGAPFPTLESGPYTIADKSDAHIVLLSGVCPQSGLQIEREIRLTSCDTWMIRHKVINQGLDTTDVGIWSVMMIKHRARIGIPGHCRQTTEVFGDGKEFIRTSKEGVICDCSKPTEFKIGLENLRARTFVRAVQGETPIWMMCDTPRPTEDDRFAHTHPLEIFNSGDYPYCEVEWHAPLQTLPPNGSTEFTQHFTVWTDVAPQSLTAPESELLKCMS